MQLRMSGSGAYEIVARPASFVAVEGVSHHTFDTNAVSHNLCYHQAGSMATYSETIHGLKGIFFETYFGNLVTHVSWFLWW